MKEYTTEELMTKFEGHSVTSRKTQEGLAQEFMEKNPGKKLPDWLIENFILSDALYCICKELYEIKKILRVQPCEPGHPAFSLDDDSP